MITAVDSNVLLDVLGADPEFGQLSRAALKQCFHEGQVIISEVVVAEVAAAFDSSENAQSAFEQLQVEFVPMSQEASLLAATIFREYKKSGGNHSRVIADFLVGAHALSCADRLLTRDRGFHRKFFEKMEVIDPTKN